MANNIPNTSLEDIIHQALEKHGLDKKDFLRAKEIEEAFNISDQTINNLGNEGKLLFTKFGSGKKAMKMYHKKHFIKYLLGNSMKEDDND